MRLPALRTTILRAALALVPVVAPLTAAAQIDSARARQYFREAAALCEKEGGRTWGVSLCGPMIFADPATRAIIANQPTPDAPRPLALGYANAALDWGGTVWSVYVWPFLPADEKARANLLMHELFHRVQRPLGLFLNEGPSNDHLNGIDGRYWLQLEWRALAAALRDSADARRSAISDALGFRAKRHSLFPSTAETERILEVNEGLPQYTATVSTNASSDDAARDAIRQLELAPVVNETLVRTFPYPSGAAYGVLLDAYSPGWPRRFKPGDDIARLLMDAAKVKPTADVDVAAARYGARELRLAEVTRDSVQRERVAALRKRFVEGPVLVIPSGKSSAFTTAGLTPIPDEGTVYPNYRTSGDWGSLEGKMVLVSTDRTTLRVPAPATSSGDPVSGDGWTLRLTTGWRILPGERAGDLRVARDTASAPR